MTFSRRKAVSLICCTVFAVTAFCTLALAQAPASIFQLDGNPANDSLTCTYGPCDYWNLINLTGSSGTNRGSSSVNTFILGTTNTLNFQGGGSKDPQPIANWGYTSTSTPNKDTLDAAYAAAYSISDFDVIFGADRLSPNGNANIGIWFFQNSVTLNGSGGFNGSHANGDVFVISAFTVGGGTSTISVYIWDQPGLPHTITSNDGQVGCTKASNNNPQVKDCAAANLLLIADPTTVCGTSDYCAITNSGTVSPTWATAANSYPFTTLQSPLFFEGGVDITAAFAVVGGTPPCFASFLEETRSSQSPTAVLKDFLLGGFPVCKITATKTYTCNSFNADGSFNYSYTGSVTNAGIGTVYGVTVTDTPVGGTATTYNCGDLAKGASVVFPTNCSSTGSNTFTTTAHPATNVANASACPSPLSAGTCASPAITATTGSVTSSDLSATSCSPHPGIAVGKSCVTAFDTSGNEIVVRVDYTGTVTNTGSVNLTNVNVTDDKGGGPFAISGTVSPGESVCYTNGQIVSAGPPATGCPTLTALDATSSTPAGAASYFPSNADAFGLVAGRIQFTDTVSATGVAPSTTCTTPPCTVGPVTHSASCVICPFGDCAAQ
ncbi:MAG TPA: hypothetical protein VG204_12970 [Terriglobia bacterium]|nr:hypothetical protein [Terriglobia bacterium]